MYGLVQGVYLACEAYVVVFQGRYLVVLLLDDAAALYHLPVRLLQVASQQEHLLFERGHARLCLTQCVVGICAHI